MIIQCEAKLIMQKKYIQCSKIFITCTFPFSTCAEQPNCALEKKPTHLISFQVQRFRRGSSSRVQIELLTSLVRVQYLIEVPVITFHFYPQQIQIFA